MLTLPTGVYGNEIAPIYGVVASNELLRLIAIQLILKLMVLLLS